MQDAYLAVKIYVFEVNKAKYTIRLVVKTAIVSVATILQDCRSFFSHSCGMLVES